MLDFADLHAFHDEAGGAVRIDLIGPTEAEANLADAIAGDLHAAVLVEAVLRTFCRIAEAPRVEPARCAACLGPVRSVGEVALVVLASPLRDRSTASITFALCRRCGGRGRDHAAVQRALRQVWPDGRVLDSALLHAVGGRA